VLRDSRRHQTDAAPGRDEGEDLLDARGLGRDASREAYAAAAIGMPPDDFYSAIESDAAAVAEFGTRPGLALIAGGLPLIADGRVAGAIGVAGAMTGADDRRIAESAIAKVESV
jgi:uncharacterized protein GlcG (DUF336 family)